MIHVNRGATSLGEFSEEEVREGLRTGRFIPTDIGWREGMANWQTLSQFPELGAAAPAPPPAPDRCRHNLRSCRLAKWPAVGTPARTWAFQCICRDPGHGAHETGRGVHGDETRRRFRRAAHLCADWWMPRRHVSLLFSLGLQSVGFFANRHDTFAVMTGMGVGSAAFILVLMPLFVVVGLFMAAAILHVCLMIVGGANQSFETTFRVIACFAEGSVVLCSDSVLWRTHRWSLDSCSQLHRIGACP